jgi:hypothetical protein
VGIGEEPAFNHRSEYPRDLHGFEGHFLKRLALQLRRDEERIRCDERGDGYMRFFSSFIVSAIHSQGLMRFMTMNPIVKPTAKTSS